MSSPPKNKGRYLKPLTGLRGIAALWVAMFHAWSPILGNNELFAGSNTFVASGWIAVDLFFILSGFIMCHVHLTDFDRPWLPATSRFLKLRLARIYPAHLVVVLLWLPVVVYALSAAAGQRSGGFFEHYNFRTFTYAALLLNGWGIPESQGWNLPSWSVGSEWFAYLTFPLAALLLLRIRSAIGWIALGALILTATFGLAAIVRDGQQYMLPETFTIVRVQSEFLLGCCTYGLFKHGRRQYGWNVFSYAGVGGVILLSSLDSARHFGSLYVGYYMPLFCLLILGLASRRTVISRLLSSRPLEFLGEISYSIYLIHALVIVVLGRLLPAFVPNSRLGGLVALAVFLATVTFAGQILYRLVELPARDYLRSTWIRDRQASPRPPELGEKPEPVNE